MFEFRPKGATKLDSETVATAREFGRGAAFVTPRQTETPFPTFPAKEFPICARFNLHHQDVRSPPLKRR